MGNFTRSMQKEYDFDGDHITVCMSRLKRKDALKLSPFIKLNDDGEMVMGFEDQMSFMDVGADILRKHITSIVGMTIEGEAVLVSNKELMDEVFENYYFIPLLSEMLNDLMSGSSVGEETEGKSEEPSEDALADSAPTTQVPSEE